MNALRFLVLSVVITLGTLVLFLYSDAGKAKVIELVLNHVNHRDYHIKIDDIESYLPLKVKFAHIKILDKGQPQVYLRGISFEGDGMALLMEKSFQGKVDIDECLLFDTPVEENHVFKPLHLPVNLDLQVACKSVLVEENGSNYFIQASGVDTKINYNPESDLLSYDGAVLLKVAGQTMPMNVSGQGGLNDFDLRFHIAEGLFDGAGRLEHLPWKGAGALDLTFTHKDYPGVFQAKFVQSQYMFSLEDLRLTSQGLEVRGEVTYDARHTNLKGELLVKLDNLKHMPVTGNLIMNTKFDYRGGDLSLQLDAKGQNLAHADYSIKDCNIALEGQKLLSAPSGKLKLAAAHAVGPLGAISSLVCEGTFQQGIGNVGLKLNGDNVNFETTLDIGYQKPTKLLKIKTLSGKYEDIDVRLDQPCDVSVASGKISMQQAKFYIMNSPLKLEGQLADNILDLKAVGEMDMLTLSRLYLAEDDVLTGKLQMDMRFTGPIDKIRMLGNAEMKGGAYENVIYGTVIKNIDLKLNADNNSIKITSATAKGANEGNISASGYLGFSDQFLDLQLRGANLMILHTDRMSLVARELELSMKGPAGQPTLAGQILVDSASYSIAPQIKSERRILNVVNPSHRAKLEIAALPTQKPVQKLFNPRLNLTLKFPPVLKIQGRGLSSTWKGKLEFTETYEQPLISGKLTVDAGNLNFLGQAVTIQKGTLKFDGTSGNIPYIDTKGKLEKPELEVTVGIVGRVTKPNIDLQSEPAMPKDEILSYLFFGKDKSKLSPIEGVQLARALAAYKGIGPDTEFLNIITDNLGLDQFSIGSGATEGSYTVKISKRLGDKIRVSLDQGMKPEDSKVELEADVTKNISVKAEHGFAGSADGASINYNWDY